MSQNINLFSSNGNQLASNNINQTPNQVNLFSNGNSSTLGNYSQTLFSNNLNQNKFEQNQTQNPNQTSMITNFMNFNSNIGLQIPFPYDYY